MNDVVTKPAPGVLLSRTFRKISEVNPLTIYSLVHSYLTLRPPWSLVDVKVRLARIIGLNIANCSAMNATTLLKRQGRPMIARRDHSAGFETDDDDPYDGWSLVFESGTWNLYFVWRKRAASERLSTVSTPHKTVSLVLSTRTFSMVQCPLWHLVRQPSSFSHSFICLETAMTSRSMAIKLP